MGTANEDKHVYVKTEKERRGAYLKESREVKHQIKTIRDQKRKMTAEFGAKLDALNTRKLVLWREYMGKYKTFEEWNRERTAKK